MQLIEKNIDFNMPLVQARLVQENKFITELFSVLKNLTSRQAPAGMLALLIRKPFFFILF